MNNPKSANLSKWLFNPFIYIAGEQALLIGWAAMLAASVVSYFSKTHFDGAIDIHFGASGKYLWFLGEQFIAWFSVVAVFYPVGLIFSKSRIRLIDVAGTMAMARIITLPVALMGFLPIYPVSLDNPVKLLLSAVFTMIPAIWMIALMFNAFSISTNIKQGKAVACFTGGLLAAEILSKVLIFYLFQFL
ncbi:hypothetical protein [Dyadobacter psychrotolerans]|uniref:Yip1 domain-containing protein n=1 Tax=Dyadobacter psychrotolerans TaxID=2541721 RepID=A0A4R5DHV1_9BACT|nr:hypothetical protein [Dyadobacter psychrotolerans]TDE13672.1 hypothetical protein E0F88_17365 [Dyadobacter psychrotolerans]